MQSSFRRVTRKTPIGRNKNEEPKEFGGDCAGNEVGLGPRPPCLLLRPPRPAALDHHYLRRRDHRGQLLQVRAVAMAIDFDKLDIEVTDEMISKGGPDLGRPRRLIVRGRT